MRGNCFWYKQSQHHHHSAGEIKGDGGEVVSQVRAFLAELLGHKPSDGFALIWTLPDKKSKWFHTSDAAASHAQTIQDRDVYVGVGISPLDFGPDRRCPSNQITGIVGVWADLDLQSKAHPKLTLPASADEALSVLPADLPPSIIVHTGNGLHVWWLFREPWLFDSDDERKEAAALVSQFHTHLRDRARQHGWTYERLADLARVLRIPGTTNYKDPANPKPVVIHSRSDARYNPSDFTAFLDAVGWPANETKLIEARQALDRFNETPLKINLSTRIPVETLDKWIAADPRFKATWFRQRSDMGDQSQSGYDLALCNFAIQTGLSEQQTVDLIVHHRFQHKQKARATIDYFRRTLATAGQSRPYSIPVPQNEGELGETDPVLRREQLCRSISQAFGIQVHGIVKVSAAQPFYRVETPEGRISFDSVAKFISQPSVRNAIAGTVGKLIRTFPGNRWRELAQMLLDACMIEDGGEELEEAGSARLVVHRYLEEIPFIASPGNCTAQEIRRPIVRNGRIGVCASDVQLFLGKTGQESITVKSVVAMLLALGATSERLRGNFREQTRWFLPPNEFDPAGYNPGGNASPQDQEVSNG
jgi:hypothetical protein